MTTLAYCKLILQKVSFDSTLFEKELKKSIHLLQPHEIKDLLNWVQLNFAETFSDIISSFDIF
jgi:hypothetical protein